MVSLAPHATFPRACVRFEKDLSAFADGELSPAARRRVLVHLDTCEACRGYLEWVETHARVHRQAAALQTVPPPALPGRDLFGALTARILRDNSDSLRRLLYELGKAYVLRSNDPSYLRAIAKRPVPIPRARQAGVRLARQSLTFTANPAAPLFERAAELLDGRLDTVLSNLDRGRRLLEELLLVDPDHAEGRLYLGFCHQLQDRPDRAAREFRRVARTAAGADLRAMGWENLGIVEEARGALRRSVRCFEAVVNSGIAAGDRRFFTSYTNLGIVHALLGEWDRSVSWFQRLEKEFPEKTRAVRGHLRRARGFVAALARRPDFEKRLRREAPRIFGRRLIPGRMT